MADDDKSVKTLATLLNFVMIVVLIGYTYNLISSGEAELDFSFDTTQVSLTILAIMVSGAMLGYYSKKDKYGAFAANIGVMIVIMSMIAIFVTPRTQVLLPLGVLGLVELGLWFWGKKKTEYGQRRAQQETEAVLAKDVDKKGAKLTKKLNKTAEKLIASAKKIEEKIDEIIKFLGKHGFLRQRVGLRLVKDEKIKEILGILKSEHEELKNLNAKEPNLITILKVLKIEEEAMEEHQEKLELIYMLPVLVQELEKDEDRPEIIDNEHKIFRRILRLEKRVKEEGKKEEETIGYEMQILGHILNVVLKDDAHIGQLGDKNKKRVEEPGKELAKMIREIIGEYKEQLKLIDREMSKEGKLKRIEKKTERELSGEGPETGDELSGGE